MKTKFFLLVLSCSIAFSGCSAPDDWITLFDGETLDGWRASESAGSWKVVDGAIVTSGDRSHLFYVGDVMEHNFTNFELSVDVKTRPGSNSGIYFHTAYQEEGWPEKGYECQVINSNPPTKTGGYVEHKMTGSIYAIRNLWKAPVPDDIWFNYRIVVRGKTIQTFINEMLAAEYTEPDQVYRPGNMAGRLLGSGTFALQCHDPESEVHYKNIKVKPLPDTLHTPGTPPGDLEFEKQLIDLASQNFPLIDLHTHLKGGLTEEVAMAHARQYGYTYGVAVNCGIKMGFETDEALTNYLDGYEASPFTWHAMQAEGREWMELFSRESRERFDYVFTDAMTWTNDNGKRMRLWIREETEVGDPEDFMEQLVERIIQIVSDEPIDIYVNPTYLPEEIAERYDELWSSARMDRVIGALVENQVALEINNRNRIPSPAFLKRAKEAGVKFTFGTNNTGPDDLCRMNYAIEMIGELGLTSHDMWIPGK
ncbi:MAG: family 16 glycoside hydrolase [Bacteroidota bacterium]